MEPLISTLSPGRAPTADYGHTRGDPADAGGIDEHQVGRPLRDHFGVSGYDPDTGGLGCRGHGLHDPFQSPPGEAFFQNKRGRKVKRLGAPHGQVVHRSVHGQFPDVAAGKEQGRYHESIRGYRQLTGREFQDRAVFQLFGFLAAEMFQKEIGDQFLGGFSSRAMVQ